jgi:hypothetical protein
MIISIKYTRDNFEKYKIYIFNARTMYKGECLKISIE